MDFLSLHSGGITEPVSREQYTGEKNKQGKLFHETTGTLKVFNLEDNQDRVRRVHMIIA